MEYIKTVALSMAIVILTLGMTAMQLLIFIPAALIQTDMYENLLDEQHFYGQVRQYSLKMMKDYLRFGETGMPYLEVALSEDFFRDNIVEILDGIKLFLTGKESVLPKIPVYKLKDEIFRIYSHEAEDHAKQDMVEYWFDPMPDNVKLSYLISVKPFWILKFIVSNFILLLAISIIFLLLMTAIISLISCDLWQGVLWVGTSIVSAAGIVAGVSLLLIWLGGYSQQSAAVVKLISDYGFPHNSISLLLKGLGRVLGLRLNIIAVVFLFIGGAMIFFAPVKDA